MKYLILDSGANGKGNKKLDLDKLSRELYKLSRPDSVRDPKDVTTHLYGIVEHPTEDQVALQIPDDGEYELPLHKDKDSKELAKIYKKFFVDKGKPDKVKDVIDKKESGRIKMKDVLPTEDFVDQQFMIDNGWFPISEDI